MKESIKVALVQMDCGPVTEKAENLAYHLDKIRTLGKQGFELIIFPELSVSGYVQKPTPEFRHEYWRLGSERLDGYTTEQISKAAKETGTHVIFGLAERSDLPLLCYNSAVLIGPEGLIGVNRKSNLPLFEKEYFLPGDEPQVFETSLGKIGSIVCYDLFFPEATRVLALKGAEIVVFIGYVSLRGNGQSGGVGVGEEKMYMYHNAPRIRAIENQVHFLACNAGGSHFAGEELGYWKQAGASKIINNLGNIVAASEETTADIVTGGITNDIFVQGRIGYPVFQDRQPRLYQQLIKN